MPYPPVTSVLVLLNWSKTSGGPPTWWGEAEGAGLSQPGEENFRGASVEDYWGAQQDETQVRRCKQEGSSWIEGRNYYKDNKALKQSVQRGCTVCPWRFTRPTLRNAPSTLLNSVLNLLWAGGWARDLLRSLPAREILCLKSTFRKKIFVGIELFVELHCS